MKIRSDPFLGYQKIWWTPTQIMWRLLFSIPCFPSICMQALQNRFTIRSVCWFKQVLIEAEPLSRCTLFACCHILNCHLYLPFCEAPWTFPSADISWNSPNPSPTLWNCIPEQMFTLFFKPFQINIVNHSMGFMVCNHHNHEQFFYFFVLHHFFMTQKNNIRWFQAQINFPEFPAQSTLSATQFEFKGLNSIEKSLSPLVGKSRLGTSLRANLPALQLLPVF